MQLLFVLHIASDELMVTSEVYAGMQGSVLRLLYGVKESW